MKKGQKMSKEQKKKISETEKGKKAWNKGISSSKETRMKISKSCMGRKAWNKGIPCTKEQKRKISIANKGRIMSNETKEKISLNHPDTSGDNNPMFGKHHSKAAREKISKANKGENNPNYGVLSTEEKKKKISNSEKGKYVPKEVGIKISNANKGENHYNWQGGISYEPYCPLFNERFKEEIREKYNRQCFICGLLEELNGNKLSIHHLNYNKNCLCDDSKCYFVPLCNSCHIRTNYNREFWEKLLTNCYKDPVMSEYFSKN